MAFPEAMPLLAPLAPWFETVKRAMPWRMADLDAPHPDPYAVLVSEIMLQQTQVATVIPYFQRWMVRFPDLATLAGASEDEIHGLWAGLGYYRRARSLQGAARALVAAGGWPGDLDGLLALPGLGPYTAAALGAQAFQWPTAALDGNAFRVLARLLALDGDPKPYAAALRTWLAPALAHHGPSRLTQAIMELGATLCGPTPRCASCPLQARCAAHRQGTTASIPPVAPRAKPKEAELYLVAIASPSGWLVRPPTAKGLLAGLWSWPSVTADLAEGAADTPLPYGTAEGRAWPGWVQVYTHRRETIHPVALRLSAQPEAPDGLRWIPAADLGALPMGKRDQRLRQHLEEAASPGALGGAEWAAAQSFIKGILR
jgi:A/G-specific adenine glycosylase